MLKPEIINIAEICFRKEVNNFILSPGSRCAPLALALLRHDKIFCRTITDERSAAFIAMGMAQQSQRPVGVLCTSGTAVLNYAPAIAEAYYQKIPLLVFTADRPPEWIDQYDNQTIRQNGIYSNYILKSFELPVSLEHNDAKWHSERIISEAINLSMEKKGPVHINVPLREPLYPETDELFSFDPNIKIIENVKIKKILDDQTLKYLVDKWNNYERILILVGLSNYSSELNKYLSEIQKNKSVVLISDITSNIHDVMEIHYSDIITGKFKEELKPQLLITFGGAFVSKYLKNFLKNKLNTSYGVLPPARGGDGGGAPESPQQSGLKSEVFENKISEHWHIQEEGVPGDTLQSLTKIINVKPEYFFEKISELQTTNNSDYFNNWNRYEKEYESIFKDFISSCDFGEFKALNFIMENLPENVNLHIGNSMPIRYANFISGKNLKNKNITINSNRGTSGIDGTLSTATGASLVNNKKTVVITGDLSFFYDRNALWNNYIHENIRIIVLNNHGGGIFRILDGSGKQPELNEFFETRNRFTTKATSEDSGLKYYFSDNYESLKSILDDFWKNDGVAKLLEIESDSKLNTQIFKELKKQLLT